MSVIINSADSLARIETGMIIVPIHVYPHKFVRHPLPEVRLRYPLAYAQMRRFGDAGLIEKGSLIKSERFAETRIVVWMPTAMSTTGKHFLDWIAAALREMRNQGLHDKYTIGFPAIGVYDADKTDVRRVFRLVKKYLSDGEKDVHFLVNY
jgi:hypothetical protein